LVCWQQQLPHNSWHSFDRPNGNTSHTSTFFCILDSIIVVIVVVVVHIDWIWANIFLITTTQQMNCLWIK
jgi:hypothetical protein